MKIRLILVMAKAIALASATDDALNKNLENESLENEASATNEALNKNLENESLENEAFIDQTKDVENEISRENKKAVCNSEKESCYLRGNLREQGFCRAKCGKGEGEMIYAEGCESPCICCDCSNVHCEDVGGYCTTGCQAGEIEMKELCTGKYCICCVNPHKEELGEAESKININVKLQFALCGKRLKYEDTEKNTADCWQWMMRKKDIDNQEKEMNLKKVSAASKNNKQRRQCNFNLNMKKRDLKCECNCSYKKFP